MHKVKMLKSIFVLFHYCQINHKHMACRGMCTSEWLSFGRNVPVDENDSECTQAATCYRNNVQTMIKSIIQAFIQSRTISHSHNKVDSLVHATIQLEATRSCEVVYHLPTSRLAIFYSYASLATNHLAKWGKHFISTAG